MIIIGEKIETGAHVFVIAADDLASWEARRQCESIGLVVDKVIIDPTKAPIDGWYFIKLPGSPSTPIAEINARRAVATKGEEPGK